MKDGKICKSIVEQIFKNNGIEWVIKDFGEYIDPKCKSANSIYDKLFRLYNNEITRNTYSIMDSKIDDLLRMTIIVEYENVVSTIKRLKKEFPDLSGYLQVEKAGYRGVHLNLKINGLPCEIQLAPKVVVMAVDFLHTLYEKWRSFNYEKEKMILMQEEKELLKTKINDEEKSYRLKVISEKKNVLELKKREESIDFNLRNKTYGEVFKVAGFEKHVDEIKEQIDEINREKQTSTPLTNQNLFNLLNANLLTNGKLDKNKVREVAELISQNVSAFQEKLIMEVKTCLNI